MTALLLILLATAQPLGYTSLSPGFSADLMLMSRNNLIIMAHTEYTRSRKVKTMIGHTANAYAGIGYAFGGFKADAGLSWNYYNAGAWEKEAWIPYIAVWYGDPGNHIRLVYSFREKQTSSNSQATSIVIRVSKGHLTGLIRVNRVTYNFGTTRKAGVSAELGVGVRIGGRDERFNSSDYGDSMGHYCGVLPRLHVSTGFSGRHTCNSRYSFNDTYCSFVHFYQAKKMGLNPIPRLSSVEIHTYIVILNVIRIIRSLPPHPFLAIQLTEHIY